jgi:hypothetical protein
MARNTKAKPGQKMRRASLSLFALTALLPAQCAWSGNSGIVAISGVGVVSETSTKFHRPSLPRNTPISDSSTLSAVMNRLNPGEKPNESQLISSAMRVVSTMYGVPNGLLRAISLTESGMSGLPWPWTLNVHGRAYRYTNEKQTVAAVRKFLARDITLVDIGPMQVDWQYHGWRFGSVRAAANPLRNVAIAAEILRDAYAKTGSWVAAVGKYHGGDTTRQQLYIHQVMTRWHVPAWNGLNTSVNTRGINLIPAKADTIVAMTNTAGNY